MWNYFLIGVLGYMAIRFIWSGVVHLVYDIQETDYYSDNLFALTIILFLSYFPLVFGLLLSSNLVRIATVVFTMCIAYVLVSRFSLKTAGVESKLSVGQIAFVYLSDQLPLLYFLVAKVLLLYIKTLF